MIIEPRPLIGESRPLHQACNLDCVSRPARNRATERVAKAYRLDEYFFWRNERFLSFCKFFNLIPRRVKRTVKIVEKYFKISKLDSNLFQFLLFTILTSRRIEFSLILPLIFVDIRVTNPPVSRVKPRYTALHCKSWKLIENKLGQRWRSHAKRPSPPKSINIHTDLSVGINYPLLPSLPIIRTYLR